MNTSAVKHQAIFVLACMFLGWTAPLEARALEANLSKTFPVEPGGTLFVEADRGGVDILTGDRQDVMVEVERSTQGLSDAAAREVLRDHEVILEKTGNRVNVRAGFKSQQWFSRDRNKLKINYRISVPRRFNLDVRTAAGNITCGDVEGTVNARTAGGSVKLQEVNGPADVSTAAGNIEARRIANDARVKTSGGSITLGELAADAAVETSAGNIRIGKALGTLKAKTSGGSISTGELAARATISTSAGSISIKGVRAPLEAVTSGGGIDITDATEAIQAHTSAGNIKVEFTAEPEGSSKFSTSGGSVQVRLPKGAGFDLDAKTSGGRVECRLPITITTSTRAKDQLEGRINGGGKALVLRTSAGNITIQ